MEIIDFLCIATDAPPSSCQRGDRVLGGTQPEQNVMWGTLRQYLLCGWGIPPARFPCQVGSALLSHQWPNNEQERPEHTPPAHPLVASSRYAAMSNDHWMPP